jgi:hypothetical protein
VRQRLLLMTQGGGMSKSKQVTIRAGDRPVTCQHYRIDNETRSCVECGERMIVQRVNAHTVLSAPNAAGCGNPACQEALKDGTYDERNPPAGCTNPSGIYIPDRTRERTLVLGYEYDYDCERCRSNKHSMTITSREVVIFPCGGAHRGDYVVCGPDRPMM